LKPFTNSTVKLHYEHSVPLPYFSYVERQIEISHWGSIAVNEFYAIENRGAILKGEFNRVDFSSRTRPSAMNALEDLEAILPQSAYGLYYRDDIGNVSSSNARKHSSYVHLGVKPRFPMMGGWKNKFYIGYNLPLKYFVKSNNDVFMLNSTFGAPFQGVISEELVVKVILPEGATLDDVILPFDVEGQRTETIYSYLDMSGRTVLVLSKKNAVDYHRKPFQVVYSYSSTELLRKPFILSGYAFVVLLAVVWGFTFSKNKVR
jgi:oligosaccharyltransferase complex subunit alpha (ribophorin I)